jgi:hypothetical protein
MILAFWGGEVLKSLRTPDLTSVHEPLPPADHYTASLAAALERSTV